MRSFPGLFVGIDITPADGTRAVRRAHLCGVSCLAVEIIVAGLAYSTRTTNAAGRRARRYRRASSTSSARLDSSVTKTL